MTALSAEVVGRLTALKERKAYGTAIVLVPPTQAGVAAAELARQFDHSQVEVLTRDVALAEWSLLLATGLPPRRDSAIAALAALNSRRSWLADHERLAILLLTRSEFALLQAHAADLYSTAIVVGTLPFVPDVSIEPLHARRDLAQWLRDRLGHLDLRGLIRSEREDVSWRVEDIYQDLQARSVDFSQSAMSAASEEAPLADFVRKAAANARPLVVLGHPGTGKTFSLRWLALEASEKPEFLGVKSPLPVLLSLGTLAQLPGPSTLYELAVESLLEAGQAAAHVLDRAVADKSAVFLLDGLDEAGDLQARRRMIDAVKQLVVHVSGCLVVMTSRIAGYADCPFDAPAYHAALSPFSDDSIRVFLTRWCELYAIDLHGSSPEARRRGQYEGSALARDVLNNPQVRELARNPLLITVLGIVHRAGVRLPDHRVELYEHAIKVLVERWNRVRSLGADTAASPLKAADAVRLLGPVAREMVLSGLRSAIPEARLRQLLEGPLSTGTLRGVASPDEAIDVFKRSVGLLVEQAPGWYAFLHLTLAEYFAARELVRSGELETISRAPRTAYLPEWREVLLLAAGELGVVRADDARCDRLVDDLVTSAAARRGQPSPSVPSLLAGLLADDPGLSLTSASKLVDTLVPKWWFERQYGVVYSFPLALEEATALVAGRIAVGRFRDVLRDSLGQSYEASPRVSVLRNVARGGRPAVQRFISFLQAADVDYGPIVLLGWERSRSDPGLASSLASFALPTFPDVEDKGARVVISRSLYTQAAEGRMQLDVRFLLRSPEKRGQRIRQEARVSLADCTMLSSVGRSRVIVRVMVDVPAELRWTTAWLERRPA